MSPSPLRQSTPKAGQVNSQSRFAASTASTPTTSTAESTTPRAKTPQSQSMADEMFGSQKTLKNSALAPTPTPPSAMGHGNALSQLQPAQVRTLREGFQILDRDSDGVVNREDVADMLNQLGEKSHHGLPVAVCFDLKTLANSMTRSQQAYPPAPLMSPASFLLPLPRRPLLLPSSTPSPRHLHLSPLAPNYSLPFPLLTTMTADRSTWLSCGTHCFTRHLSRAKERLQLQRSTRCWLDSRGRERLAAKAGQRVGLGSEEKCFGIRISSRQ